MTDSIPTTMQVAHPGDDIESLCKEYCPPLEAGLVYALASDFNLDDPQSLEQLRTTLNELKESAAVEQELELLPQENDSNDAAKAAVSTTSDLSWLKPVQSSSRASDSAATGSVEGDAVTSVTTTLSALKHSDADGSDFGHESGYGEASVDFDALSNDKKSEWLCSMFPSIAVKDVKEVLARCDGHFDRSTDELLNISFLAQNREDHGNQDYVVPKGVDAFMQEDSVSLNRKAKGKGRRNKNRTDHRELGDGWGSDSAMSSGAVTPNIWKDLPEDVEFIASRTTLRPKTITSVYHANGARLAPTIRAFAIKEGEVYAKATHKTDAIMELQMDELRCNFTHVPDAQIYGSLVLANNHPSAAKELLDAMSASNEQPVLLGKVTGLASYTPINLTDDESKPKRSSGGNWSLTPASSGVYTTSHLANTHGIAATEAFQQASSAYRRGKSDHLMGGAAAYYASVGHERVKAAKATQAAAADAHVASQSSATSIDLHGVNVADAVRIAQRATESWWEGLGDRKYVVGGKGNGYRIVTGVGRHSSDGRSRIGPAVSKMLVREGWKVEVGTGQIIVSGRARR